MGYIAAGLISSDESRVRTLDSTIGVLTRFVDRVSATILLSRLEPAQRRAWFSRLAIGSAMAILVAGAVSFIGTLSTHRYVPNGDIMILRDATQRLFDGGSWYQARQVIGSYDLAFGDVNYPPVLAWFIAPWLLLPAWTFAAMATAGVALFVMSCRPAHWAWPIIAICAVNPPTILYVIYGNTSLWVALAVGLGLRYRWPSALILMKPSLLPFALIGVRSRLWWLAVAIVAGLSIPFLAQTLEYPRVILNMRGPGLAYSLGSVPLLLIPVVAWVARR